MSSSNGEDTASLFVNIIELVANFYIRVYSLQEIGQFPGPFRPFYEISGFTWLKFHMVHRAGSGGDTVVNCYRV